MAWRLPQVPRGDPARQSGLPEPLLSVLVQLGLPVLDWLVGANVLNELVHFAQAQLPVVPAP